MSTQEPTPGPCRHEAWTRRDAALTVHIDERGIVEVSAEMLRLLLVDAGWERTS